MRTVILYGNCQAEFMCNLLSAQEIVAEILTFVYIPSYHDAANSEALVSEQEISQCSLLCEQVDWSGFPHRDRLPPDCATVRFPPLDSTLLWPFTCPNPYNKIDPPRFPYGRFVNGDRIILREIDRNAPAQEILSFYLNDWSKYKINVHRVREIEWGRLRKRDEMADVQVADLIIKCLATQQLFWNVCHPKREILANVMERLMAVCARHEPELGKIDVQAAILEHPEIGANLGAVEVPVHPDIADGLSLDWYQPDAKYLQYGGYRYSYAQYFDELINYSIHNKNGMSGDATAVLYGAAWQAPLRGTALADETTGYYPDGFMSRNLAFRIIPLAPTSLITVAGYCPPQHHGSLVLDFSIDQEHCTSIQVQPGALFSVVCMKTLNVGQHAKLEVRSSRVLNMLERGDGEDSRDLSVIIQSIDAT